MAAGRIVNNKLQAARSCEAVIPSDGTGFQVALNAVRHSREASSLLNACNMHVHVDLHVHTYVIDRAWCAVLYGL